MFGAVVFGVHCISLSSSGIITFQWVPSLWPGASLIGIITVAMLFGLMHAYTYAQIGAAAPRSGADYALGSRTLHPIPAFAASFTLVIFSGLVAGSLVAWIPTVVLPALFQAAGALYGSTTATDLAAWCQSPWGVFIIGTIGVAITYASLLLPTRRVVQILGIGFFLGLAAWALILFAFATGDPETFSTNWDRFVGEGNFDGVIAAAQAAGMGEATSSFWTATLAGLIMGFWVFYGYYIPTFFAGELKQAPRTLLAGGWGSLLVTWGIFTLGALLLYRSVSREWLSAEGYLASQSDYPAFPFVNFYASVLQPNIIVFLVIAVGFVYTLINLAQTYFFYCSRIMFAWAFDRVVPERIAYVSPRTGSPVVAVTLIAILAWIGVILSALESTLFVQLNFVFFAVVTMLVPVTAAIVYPYRRRELWEAGPALIRQRIFGIPTMTLVGIGTLLYLLWLILSVFLFPAVGFENVWASLAILAAMVLGGVGIFLCSWIYRKRVEGIDIMDTFRYIPPE